MRVGNDIVDLSSPAARGKSDDSRFVERVLTKTERAQVRRSLFPDDLLWAFWAAKETAYKAVSKSVPGISSAPKKYPVFLFENQKGARFTGVVRSPDRPVFVEVYHYGDALHCIGKTGPRKTTHRLVHGIERIEDGTGFDADRSSDSVSNHVRSVAKAAISRHAACDPTDITITKATRFENSKYPTVRIRYRQTFADISLSHDGWYVAYAFYVSTKGI